VPVMMTTLFTCSSLTDTGGIVYLILSVSLRMHFVCTV
jgi:hypothetical protein